MTNGKKLLDEVKSKVKKEQKEMKKLSTKWAVIISIIATAVVTGGLIYGGIKLHESIFNSGVQAEKQRQAAVVSEVVKTVEQLKASEQK